MTKALIAVVGVWNSFLTPWTRRICIQNQSITSCLVSTLIAVTVSYVRSFFFFLLCPVLLVAQSLFQDAGYFSCCMHDLCFFSFSVVAFNSVQFSCSVVSDSFRPHGLQHVRLPCPSPTPGACSNSCPSSWWCHPTISSSVIPFSSCLQSFPASGSFPRSQFFTSGGQGIAASASASVLPMNIQDWFPLGWTGWISLESKGLSRVFSNTTVQKHWSHRFSTCIWISCPWAFVYTFSYAWIIFPLFSFLFIKI